MQSGQPFYLKDIMKRLRELRVEVHHAKNKITGFTVHHSLEAPHSKSGAFSAGEHETHAFSEHKAMIDHVTEHLEGLSD